MKKSLISSIVGLSIVASSGLYADIGKTLNPINGHYYKQVHQGVSWAAARDACFADGGYLVTITNATEHDWVVANMMYGAEFTWIGATDNEEEGKWKWVTGEPFVYTNWYPGMPDNYKGVQDYGIIAAWTKKWDDNIFIMTDAYICEYSDDYKPKIFTQNDIDKAKAQTTTPTCDITKIYTQSDIDKAVANAKAQTPTCDTTKIYTQSELDTKLSTATTTAKNDQISICKANPEICGIPKATTTTTTARSCKDNILSNVVSGKWNMMGAIGDDCTRIAIKSYGTNVSVYPFDAINNAYSTDDVIKKGFGFWVKGTFDSLPSAPSN